MNSFISGRKECVSGWKWRRDELPISPPFLQDVSRLRPWWRDQVWTHLYPLDMDLKSWVPPARQNESRSHEVWIWQHESGITESLQKTDHSNNVQIWVLLSEMNPMVMLRSEVRLRILQMFTAKLWAIMKSCAEGTKARQYVQEYS